MEWIIQMSWWFFTRAWKPIIWKIVIIVIRVILYSLSVFLFVRSCFSEPAFFFRGAEKTQIGITKCGGRDVRWWAVKEGWYLWKGQNKGRKYNFSFTSLHFRILELCFSINHRQPFMEITTWSLVMIAIQGLH